MRAVTIFGRHEPNDPADSLGFRMLHLGATRHWDWADWDEWDALTLPVRQLLVERAERDATHRELVSRSSAAFPTTPQSIPTYRCAPKPFHALNPY